MHQYRPSPGAGACCSDTGLHLHDDKAKQIPGCPNIPIPFLCNTQDISQTCLSQQYGAPSGCLKSQDTKLLLTMAPSNTMGWLQKVMNPTARKTALSTAIGFPQGMPLVPCAVPACAPTHSPIPPAAATHPALCNRRWHRDLALAQREVWRGWLAAVHQEGESQLSLCFSSA